MPPISSDLTKSGESVVALCTSLTFYCGVRGAISNKSETDCATGAITRGRVESRQKSKEESMCGKQLLNARRKASVESRKGSKSGKQAGKRVWNAGRKAGEKASVKSKCGKQEGKQEWEASESECRKQKRILVVKTSIECMQGSKC